MEWSLLRRLLHWCWWGAAAVKHRFGRKEGNCKKKEKEIADIPRPRPSGFNFQEGEETHFLPFFLSFFFPFHPSSGSHHLSTHLFTRCTIYESVNRGTGQQSRRETSCHHSTPESSDVLHPPTQICVHPSTHPFVQGLGFGRWLGCPLFVSWSDSCRGAAGRVQYTARYKHTSGSFAFFFSPRISTDDVTTEESDNPR